MLAACPASSFVVFGLPTPKTDEIDLHIKPNASLDSSYIHTIPIVRTPQRILGLVLPGNMRIRFVSAPLLTLSSVRHNKLQTSTQQFQRSQTNETQKKRSLFVVSTLSTSQESKLMMLRRNNRFSAWYFPLVACAS